MGLKKLPLLLLLVVLGLFTFGLNVSAESTSNELTEEEYKYLLNEVGHTMEEIEDLPIEVAKELVKNEAEIIDSVVYYDNIETENDDRVLSILGEIGTLGIIPNSDIKVAGVGYKVTSDRSGYNKFYLYGNFEWLNDPAYTLIDKFAIGLPSSAGFAIPMSNGSPTQHSSRYCYDFWGEGNWSCGAIKSTVSNGDWDAGAGVAARYDLKGYSDFTLHKGYVGQYIYTLGSNHGTTNVKFEYGHKRISGMPSISVYPAGLGIVPTSATDTRSYGIELVY
ncbi:hypothetical protein [Ornithinibacillus contaminans]|uniref:hypothetical protein n=1 Tax=Ornithinibacillus contaminans TaxID=694055 RepID=UPI00064D8C7D|nr:hypothetical protein [Ornithinibacillus contaminans]